MISQPSLTYNLKNAPLSFSIAVFPVLETRAKSHGQKRLTDLCHGHHDLHRTFGPTVNAIFFCESISPCYMIGELLEG